MQHHPDVDFNPRPPRGGRPASAVFNLKMGSFQSTPPARGATVSAPSVAIFFVFQSTPPARGATALRAALASVGVISIHAPREGGDPERRFQPCLQPKFQSTPPARGATRRQGRLYRRRVHFNPRPPRGGRLRDLLRGFEADGISIHAPREGGDGMNLPTSSAKTFI